NPSLMSLLTDDQKAQISGTLGDSDRIEFNIPWSDHGNDSPWSDPNSNRLNGHVYYRGSLGNVQLVPTGTSSDADIHDFAPQWEHSWWRIQLTSKLPTITQPVVIDGYTHSIGQPPPEVATYNTKPNDDDAVLRIELTGRDPQGHVTDNADGLTITAGQSTVR